MSINANDLRQYVIQPALQSIGLWSQAAENLLLGTAAKESKLGYYLKQIRGPALGIYQIEPATHQSILKDTLAGLPVLATKIKGLATSVILDDELIYNLRYATAIARMVYYRIKAPLPAADDVMGLANYWKQYYNTVHGAGQPNEFVAAYNQLILGNK